MRPQPHLLYICDNPPREGWGCPIIIKRHLSRLSAKGWRISVVFLASHQGGSTIPGEWDKLGLPTLRLLKKAPIPGAFRLLTLWWEYRIIAHFIMDKPSAILSYTDESLSTVAAKLAKRWEIPFNLIMFDHRELWEKKDSDRKSLYHQTQILVEIASRIWVVSERLIDEYKQHLYFPDPDIVRVLRPIPEAKQRFLVNATGSFSKTPVIVHAGSSQLSHEEIFSLLARLLQRVNGSLVLIEKPENIAAKNTAARFSNVIHQPYFQTNQEAFDFIIKKASCVLHTYAFDINEQPWSTASFPSKLIEYSYTGLPIFILVPPGTATHDWAMRRKWLAFADKLDDTAVLPVLLNLINLDTWESMAHQSEEVAGNEFSAEHIQQQFENELIFI